MPYGSSGRLPVERASKLGHLEVVNNPLVKELLESFESPGSYALPDIETGLHDYYSFLEVKEIVKDASRLDVIFAVDGSRQVIGRTGMPEKELAFIKTAMVTLNMEELSKIDPVHPHPKQLKDAMEKSALYHSTVIPLRNVRPSGMDLETGIRQVIYQSLRDPSFRSEDTGVDEVYATLKWLIFEEWISSPKSVSEKFHCPFCQKVECQVERGKDRGLCGNCGGEVLLTDYLGFHLEMDDESAYGVLATSYMLIHETLLLFTAIRHFWENDRDFLSRCLFIKDGGLYIRAHYSKLVQPIRRFLEHARSQGVIIHLLGQEKTGPFVDFLDLWVGHLRHRSNGIEKQRLLFIPHDYFIRKEILGRTDMGIRRKDPYGKTSNYGSKVFYLSSSHNMVLTIATGLFKENPTVSDLLGIDSILVTLPHILSFRYENALLPIELANGVASLSTFPSAKILELFARAKMKT